MRLHKYYVCLQDIHMPITGTKVFTKGKTYNLYFDQFDKREFFYDDVSDVHYISQAYLNENFKLEE